MLTLKEIRKIKCKRMKKIKKALERAIEEGRLTKVTMK